MIETALLVVIVICIIALALAALLARNLLSQDEGTPKMREVSDAIKVGAEAFIKRQYSTIAIIAVVLAIVIFAVYYFTGQQSLAVYTAFAYIVGATCSAVAGCRRNVHCRQDKHPHGSRSPAQRRESTRLLVPWRSHLRPDHHLDVTPRCLPDVHRTRGRPADHPVRHHRVRFRCLICCTLRPARRRYLHESR